MLFAVVLAVFWPATRCDYIRFDDDRYVAENPHVSTGISAANLRWAFTAVYENWWLPLLWISFMLDTVLFGSGPFGHHFVNILLHAANAALLFWILSRMTKTIWASALVAALFALHPLRVEAVAWIAARKDVLSGLFFMLALLAYLRHADRPSAGRLMAVTLFMLGGLMSKAILVILPPVLLLLDFWPLRRAGDPRDRREWPAWRGLLLEKWPLILLAAAFVGLNLRTHETGGAAYAAVPPLVRLGLVFPNFWTYFRKLLWPTDLSILYPEHDVANWTVSVAALAGLLAATAFAWSRRNRQPWLLVGWLWFLVALLPVIRGLRLGYAAYADRFTYLPSIGLFLMIVWTAFAHLPSSPRFRPLWTALACALLAAGAIQVRAVLPLWKDTRVAFENVLAHAPDYPLAHNNLGAYFAANGRFPEAQVHLERCLQLQPGSIDGHLNLASLNMATGNLSGAATHYRAVLESAPFNDEALNNLAWLLAVAPGATPAQSTEALTLALRALQHAPVPSAALLDTVSVALAANRRFPEAVRTAEQALQRAQADGMADLARPIAQRLAMFRRGQPWREEPHP